MTAALRRWLRFNAVGLAGAAVQTGVLALLTRGLDLGVLPATALAVEAAVLHNYFWHCRWTWRGRSASLARFHLSSAVLPMAVNLTGVHLLVRFASLDPVVAGVVAIAAASLVNFFAADRFAFRA